MANLAELLGRASQKEREKRSSGNLGATALVQRIHRKKHLHEVQKPKLPALVPELKQAVTEVNESTGSHEGKRKRHMRSRVTKLPSLVGAKKRENGTSKLDSSKNEVQEVSDLMEVKAPLTNSTYEPTLLMMYQPFQLSSPYRFSYFS